MRGHCEYCGRTLFYANIPNRGPVMAHRKGEGEACRKLIEMGRDIPTRRWVADNIALIRGMMAIPRAIRHAAKVAAL